MKHSRFLLKWSRSNGVTLQDVRTDGGHHNIPAFSSKGAGIIKMPMQNAHFQMRQILNQKKIFLLWVSSIDIHCPSPFRTSKFHWEFMSPALFLFELLKMSKLTRGPLVLYHLPKYKDESISNQPNLFPVEIHLFFFNVIVL